MSDEKVNPRVYIHLSDPNIKDSLLSAIKITDLMGWSDLYVIDLAGHALPLSADEQAQLVKEAARRAGGATTLFEPFSPVRKPHEVVPASVYACPNDMTHPKHIVFTCDPVPMCQVCQPPVACHPWQPTNKKR